MNYCILYYTQKTDNFRFFCFGEYFRVILIKLKKMQKNKTNKYIILKKKKIVKNSLKQWYSSCFLG